VLKPKSLLPPEPAREILHEISPVAISDAQLTEVYTVPEPKFHSVFLKQREEEFAAGRKSLEEYKLRPAAEHAAGRLTQGAHAQEQALKSE
jgi:hypothetical protein